MNNHIIHLEDLAFFNPEVLMYVIKDFESSINNGTPLGRSLTIKWDGAPAIFAGRFNGNFVLAKKSIFNRTPKYYTSMQSILDDKSLLDTDLMALMVECFNVLKKETFFELHPNTIFQGDLLFWSNRIRVHPNGEEYEIKPNTIKYKIPSLVGLGNRIGVAWHTEYQCRPDVNELKIYDSVCRPFTHEIVMKNCWCAPTEVMWDVSKISRKTLISRVRSPRPISHPQVLNHLQTYVNRFIRDGNDFPHPNSMVFGFIHYISSFYEKKIDSMKTPNGKMRWAEEKCDALNYIYAFGTHELQDSFDFFQRAVTAKSTLINILNKQQSRVYLCKDEDHEGYVYEYKSDMLIKLVDRRVFSKRNFDHHSKKRAGWEDKTI